MISTIVILVLLAIIVLLFAVVIVAHKKQADALGILTALSAVALSWLTFWLNRPKLGSGDGKGTK